MKKITINGETYVLEKDILDNTADNNTGNGNSGDRNTGNGNSGNLNVGDLNTGYSNTGDRNAGDLNTGDWNVGALNVGNWNAGERNTGDLNTGYWNTGDLNTGDWNTGDRNTGGRNTGDYNTGYWNTGKWNAGNRNTGFFNTNEPTVRLFNKDSGLYKDDIKFPIYFYFDFPTTKWIKEEDMTDEERKENPSYKTTGGYLKVYKTDKTLKTYRKKAFEKAPIKEIEETLELPNFDYDIFEEITGISKKDFDIKLGKDVIEIGGVE